MYELFADRVENVREVSVIGIPHPYKMQVIKAYVALANPAVPSDKINIAF